MKSPTKTTINEKLKLESEKKTSNNHELFKANRGSHNNTIWYKSVCEYHSICVFTILHPKEAL